MPVSEVRRPCFVDSVLVFLPGIIQLALAEWMAAWCFRRDNVAVRVSQCEAT